MKKILYILLLFAAFSATAQTQSNRAQIPATGVYKGVVNTNFVGKKLWGFGNSVLKGYNGVAVDSTHCYFNILAGYLGCLPYNRAIIGSMLMGGSPSSPLGVSNSNSLTHRLSTLPVYDTTSAGIIIQYDINEAIYNGGTYTPANYKLAQDTVLNYLINTNHFPTNKIWMVTGTDLDSTSFAWAATQSGNPAITQAYYQQFIAVTKASSQKWQTQFIDAQVELSQSGGVALNNATDHVHLLNRGNMILADAMFEQIGAGKLHLAPTVAGILVGDGNNNFSAAATTGTGSVVKATSPTFVTDLTTPKVIFPSSFSGSGIMQYNTSGATNFGEVGFYPTVTNAASSFALYPSGTGNSSTLKTQFALFNTDYIANSTNFELLLFRAAGTNGYGLSSIKAGTGTIRQIWFDATNSNSSATANLLLNVDGTTTTNGQKISGRTETAGTNTTALASTAFVSTAITNAFTNPTLTNAVTVSGASAGVSILRDYSNTAASGPFINFANAAGTKSWEIQPDASNNFGFNYINGGGWLHLYNLSPTGAPVGTTDLTPKSYVDGATINKINGTPTIAAGTGAGTSPTVSVTSNGVSLQVTVTTGTLPTGTNATIATVTLANALPYTPYPVFSGANANTSLLSAASMVYMTSTGTTNVTITSGTTALTAATTYVWNIAL